MVLEYRKTDRRVVAYSVGLSIKDTVDIYKNVISTFLSIATNTMAVIQKVDITWRDNYWLIKQLFRCNSSFE